MTRDEIENALLKGDDVYSGVEGEGPIRLRTPHGRRLAEVVFNHLRSSTVDDLARNTDFFAVLEAAFREDDGDTASDSGARDETKKAEAVLDHKTWRLKRVKTKGFGGLNTATGDLFEFDMAGRDFCIEGQNGSGKSSLTNAILFAMTGKTHRDQYGLWHDPARSEPVMSDTGDRLGNWPPVAAYPDNWKSAPPSVDVTVTLTFGNETDEEEIEATRRMHGKPRSLSCNESIDPRLAAVPPLIDAALLMPMRVQHIRVPESDDNSQLVGLVRQLIGLEPLLDVASLADKLTFRNQRFLKYAKDNDSQGKAERISGNLQKAQEKIKDLDSGIDLTLDVQAGEPVPESRLRDLCEAKIELDRRQSNGFQQLAALAFNGFDQNESEHRRRVADAINKLHADASRQSDPKNLPPVLRGIAILAERVGKDDFEASKSALQKATADLNTAIEWAGRQKEDVLLRLKAVAAEHFEDCCDPLCPLCKQAIGGPEHQDLVADLRKLKTDAEQAQTRLDDACRLIKQRVRDEVRHVVPEEFLQVKRFAVKQDIVESIRETYIEAPHVADNLPGFVDSARTAVDAAFEKVNEVEFGSALPKLADGDQVGRMRNLISHLESVFAAAENWLQFSHGYRCAWRRLFIAKDEQSLTARILQRKDMVESVEPFRLASENVGRALEIAAKYNDIIKQQKLRESIVQELGPLRRLRKLVNHTTRQTIDEVSDAVKKFHDQIYNPEGLTYEKTELPESRGKQSLTIQAKLGEDPDWRIDASLLANVSWMRGILWSFVFAIREKAIKRSGYCPFELMVLDDPQMTFDTRNMKGWVRFLGCADGLRQWQPCQLLVTTHSNSFALDMTAMLDIQMAKIETGQPWSYPAQVIKGDFAAVRYERMVKEKSDDLARHLIGDIRVLAETLLKHSIERFDPELVRRPKATLGHMIGRIANWKDSEKQPYTDPVFGKIIALKSSNPSQFNLLNEAHHSNSESIAVNEAKKIYQFWNESLFPAVHDIWMKYRFLQKSVIGEAAAIPLPDNCNHKPLRSTALASVQPKILGRVSAYSEGRAASAIRIDLLEDSDPLNLDALTAYRLERDTLSPVARTGDILLARLDAQCRATNLVVEDRGAFRIARRWHEDAAAPDLAVLTASSSNPREVPDAVVSRAKGANRRKIVGVLFAAEQLRPGEKIDPNSEAKDLDADNSTVTSLIADTSVFEVQGSSAEPIALDKQYLLAKPDRADWANALGELDGRPVIAQDSEGCAFFKRLRLVNSTTVILESLDKTGSEGPIQVSVDPNGPAPALTRVREVVGVIFDKLQ